MPGCRTARRPAPRLPSRTRHGSCPLRGDREGAQTGPLDSLEASTKLRQEMLAVLERYDTEVLGIYGLHGKDVLFSSLCGVPWPAGQRRRQRIAPTAIAPE